MIKYKIKNENGELKLVFTPIISGKDAEFKIGCQLNKAWPVMFYTATTDMRDFIGNVTEIVNNKCSVKGVYRGSMVNLKGVIIKEDKIIKVGQRVMITEHINIEGKLELLATTRRIINLSDSNLNFVNIGWSNESECYFCRIDIYTGEYRFVKGESVPMARKGKV